MNPEQIKDYLIEKSYDDFYGCFYELSMMNLNIIFKEDYPNVDEKTKQMAIDLYYIVIEDILYDEAIKTEQQRLRFL